MNDKSQAVQSTCAGMENNDTHSAGHVLLYCIQYNNHTNYSMVPYTVCAINMK